jgi:hypothetical protein
MNREEVIRWARQAGWSEIGADLWGAANDGAMSTYALTRFAAQAYAAGAAAEREACAKACEDDPSKAGEWTEDAHTGGYYAEIIRARGQA